MATLQVTSYVPMVEEHIEYDPHYQISAHTSQVGHAVCTVVYTQRIVHTVTFLPIFTLVNTVEHAEKLN